MARSNFGPRETKLFGAEGGRLFFDIPLEVGAFLLATTFFLRGSLVISGGTTSGAFVGENPGAFVQSIQLDATSAGGKFRGGKMRNLTARSILRRRIFDRGYLQPDLSLGASGLSGAAGTFTLNQPYTIHHALPRLRNQFNTAFCCDGYTQATFTITTGTKALMNPTTDRTWSEAALQFDHVDDRVWPAAGYKVAELYDDDRPFIINAAQSRTPFNNILPQDAPYLDALLIAQSTASNTLVDTIVNRVTWFSGSAQVYDAPNDYIKAYQERYITDFAASMTGLYYTPIDRDGLLGSAMYGMTGVLDLSNPGGAGADNLIVATRRTAPGSAGA